MRLRPIFALCGAAAILALGSGTAQATAAPKAAQPTAADWARLGKLEDYQAIQRLLAQYQTAVDSNNWPVYGSLFAKEGELIFQKNHWKGPTAIQAEMQAAEDAPNSVLKTGGLRHPTMNQDITLLGGDRAKAVTRWTVLSRQPDGRPLLGATGRIEDTLIRENGQWKFLRRVLYTEIPFQDPIADQAAKP